MRTIAIAALALVAPAGSAPLPADAIYATATEIGAIQAQAAASVLPGHGSASKPLMTLGAYTAKVEYHTGANFVGLHPQQAEMFHAIEGGGTLVTGGVIVGSGLDATIRGGQTHHISAGDMFIVPEGMPHWFPRVDGHMVLVSVMLPRSGAVPAAAPPPSAIPTPAPKPAR